MCAPDLVAIAHVATLDDSHLPAHPGEHMGQGLGALAPPPAVHQNLQALALLLEVGQQDVCNVAGDQCSSQPLGLMLTPDTSTRLAIQQ